MIEPMFTSVISSFRTGAIGLLVTVPTTLYAATAKSVIDSAGNSECDFKTGKLDPSCLNTVIANAIDIVFAFAGAICLLNIIVAGYQIALGNATASGDTGGKERLRWALIGFFVTASTFGIINAVLSAIV